MESTETEKSREEHAGQSLLSEQAIQRRLKDIPDWSLMNKKAIEREFVFKDFHEAMNFVNQVAEISEQENHHPDIFISYNKVKLDLSTHKLRGLTSKDFNLAAKVDRLI